MEQACLYLTEKRYPDDCTATRKRQIGQKAKKFAVMHILMLKVCSRPHWVKYLHLNLRVVSLFKY